MSELVFEGVIGNGSYGIVYRGLWADQVVALKKFSEQKISEEESSPVVKEIALLRKLKHPHIIEVRQFEPFFFKKKNLWSNVRLCLVPWS